MSRRASALFCALAGGGDAVTGLLLVAAPALVLRLLGIARPETAGELALLRFLGVFVGCVGLACLYPWSFREGVRRQRRIVAAMEMTAGVRLAVALFLGIAVARGWMDLPWLTVGVYDALVGTAQLGLLGRDAFGGGEHGI